MLSAIQPLLRQRMLEAMRVRKISQLEAQRKSRVIAGAPAGNHASPATSTSTIRKRFCAPFR